MPVRISSGNGVDTSIDNWDLLGRSVPITLTAGGKSVTMTRQIICPQQDRSDGSCSSSNGNYMFLFQLQSTATNVTINIGKLVGFKAVTGDGSGTYGVMICDDAENQSELCTEDPNDPNYSLISGITFKVTSKSEVTFTIPSFPRFPAGVNPLEGQGLTLFIVTQQSAPLPIAYPSIGD
jgi:hypothetical protein